MADKMYKVTVVSGGRRDCFCSCSPTGCVPVQKYSVVGDTSAHWEWRGAAMNFTRWRLTWCHRNRRIAWNTLATIWADEEEWTFKKKNGSKRQGRTGIFSDEIL